MRTITESSFFRTHRTRLTGRELLEILAAAGVKVEAGKPAEIAKKDSSLYGTLLTIDPADELMISWASRGKGTGDDEQAV